MEMLILHRDTNAIIVISSVSVSLSVNGPLTRQLPLFLYKTSKPLGLWQSSHFEWDFGVKMHFYRQKLSRILQAILNGSKSAIQKVFD